MDSQRIGAVVRALRHGRALRLIDVQELSGVSDSVICEIEHGRLEGVSLRALSRVLAALDANLNMAVRWRGGEVDRLLDADHAHLIDEWQRRLFRAGWAARPEVSFNHYGDRGRIDCLAFHAPTRTLLATEGKTGIFDAQSLLGSMDVKERLAIPVARRLGWNAVSVVSCLLVSDGRTNRRRISDHSELFRRFDCRGRRALAWLRSPRFGVGGLLIVLSLPESGGAGRRRAGRQRIRLRRSSLSVGEEVAEPAKADSPA